MDVPGVASAKHRPVAARGTVDPSLSALPDHSMISSKTGSVFTYSSSMFPSGSVT
jgi:hypothetical protein